MGMCGWYRRFIGKFSTIAAPLTDLTKKGVKIKWSDEANESFNLLKKTLSTAPVPANPDFEKPFYIQCDASTAGVRSVLFQLDSDGEERPIAFISQKLNAAQRNYSITELECYAAVLSVKKFRACIEGYNFTIYTDHASLRWLMSQKDLSGRLARWSLKLQAFNFQIGYRKGSVNVVPDALSRMHCEEPAIISSVVRPSENLRKLGAGIDPDPLDPMHIELDSPAFNDPEYQEQMEKIRILGPDCPSFCVKENKLLFSPSFGTYYDVSDVPTWKLVVPTKLTYSLVKQAHIPPSSAHMGIAKTLDRLRRQFYWHGMALDVKDFINNCQDCKKNKSVNYNTKPAMGHQFVSQRPFQRLYIDLLGPYPRSKKGNAYILIILDHYSKFVILRPLREASAALICNFLENDVFLLFSVPEVITSDNGKQFLSKLFQELLRKYGVDHIRTPVHSPQSNASERVNRTILSAIRSYLTDTRHNEWDLHVQEISAALRNVVHGSTRFFPHFVVFGQHMIHGSEYQLRRLLSTPDENENYVLSKSDRLNLVRAKIINHLNLLSFVPLLKVTPPTNSLPNYLQNSYQQ